MITLYDAGPTLYSDKTLGFSPFVKMIIFTLRYKNLPYKIIEVGYDEIESTAKSIGAPPTRSKPDGSPKYTLPIIQDSTTGKVVSDSFKIAVYLDQTYPDTPKVVPDGTLVLQSVFADTLFKHYVYPVFLASRQVINTLLGEETLAAQLRILGDEFVNPKLSPEEEKQEWGKVEASFEFLGKAYGEQKGPFVMGGDKPTFADFVVAGFLVFLRETYGKDSEKWKEVSGWAGGRVGALCSEVLLKCGLA
ncbi:hypothetical protein V5O48_015483 [Marasmius crinis-equi]|uniref:GST N-terminal domain-containing protein n=1 Tax=Marasmius crinis-equi TaxID=585013 RepID=A0ABR3EUE4_9AGAR